MFGSSIWPLFSANGIVILFASGNSFGEVLSNTALDAASVKRKSATHDSIRLGIIPPKDHLLGCRVIGSADSFISPAQHSLDK